MDERTMTRGVYTRPGSSFLWCRYAGPGGIEVRESTKTKSKAAAERYRAGRMREVKAGTWRESASHSRITVAQYGEQWIDLRQRTNVLTWKDEATRLRRYVFPKIGHVPLDLVRRPQVVEVVRAVQREHAHLSPRSVLHVYGVMRLMFGEAVSDETLTASPCSLRTKRGELPVKRDKDPRWRASSRYTLEELRTLIAHPSIPLRRRAWYGLMLLGGLRPGEAIGARVHDYDRSRKPLGALLVATQYDDRETKTGSVREVPVHPALAALLAEWLLSGFAFAHGRPPRPGDFLFPSTHQGAMGPLSKKTLEWVKKDLRRLGLRTTGRGRHAMRHAFISIAQDGGASRDVLETITHDGSDRRAISGYTVYAWDTLCDAVLKVAAHSTAQRRKRA